MNNYIEKSPFEKFTSDIGTYSAAGLIFLLATMVLSNFDEDILEIVGNILGLVLQYAMVWFFYNAAVRGKPVLNDLFAMFSKPGVINKLPALILVELIIETVVVLATDLFDGIPFIGWAVAILISLITMLFIPVKVMFAANQNYPTASYFTKAAEFMGDKFFDYLILVIKYSAISVGIIILFGFLGFLGIILGAAAIGVMFIVMEIEITDFMIKEIIPPRWYDGQIF